MHGCIGGQEAAYSACKPAGSCSRPWNQAPALAEACCGPGCQRSIHGQHRLHAEAMLAPERDLSSPNFARIFASSFSTRRCSCSLFWHARISEMNTCEAPRCQLAGSAIKGILDSLLLLRTCRPRMYAVLLIFAAALPRDPAERCVFLPPLWQRRVWPKHNGYGQGYGRLFSHIHMHCSAHKRRRT